MRLQIKIRKSGKFWLIEAPALDVMTQGRSRTDACRMLEDAIELLADHKHFNVTVCASTRGTNGYLESRRQDLLIALLLRRQRQKHGVTLKEAARRMGSTSVNSYARYEQARARPTVAKLTQLMTAIHSNLHPILAIGR